MTDQRIEGTATEIGGKVQGGLGDLTGDYTHLELVSTIATMETFQKIYRPEIYNANSPATEQYQPSLKAQDYSLTRIVYDSDERSRLAVEQGRFVEH